jgi:phage-related protein
MFKLSELFVEISAKDKPFQDSIAGLKGKVGGIASSLGSGIGSAITTALSTINPLLGATTALFSKLFGEVEEGNEEIAAVGSYFTEAFGPIKDLLGDLVTSVATWAAESSVVQSAFEKVKNVVADMTENLKIAIDRGVEVFNTLKDAAVAAFTAVSDDATLAGSVLSTVFAPAIAQAQEFASVIQNQVVSAIKTVGVAIRNWPEVMALVWIELKEKIINIGEIMQTIPANARIIGEYLANNWRQLIVDAVTAVGTAFKNLGENLGRLGYAIVQFIKNPAGGFEFEWTPLLDGFKATAAKLPELIKPELTRLTEERAAVMGRIAANELRGFKAHEAAKKKIEDEAATETKDKFRATSLGVAEYSRRLQEQILSPKDDTQKIANNELKAINKNTKETLDEAKKKKAAILG